MTTRARAEHGSRPHGPLQIVPLGGLGEFGNNCTVLRHGSDLIVIDAGLLFPEEQSLGVNFVIPDMTYLEERIREVRGIVLTHAHEDHVGALPWLYQKVKAPVYGSDFTLGLAARRLREHGLPHERQLKRVTAGDEISLGPFDVEFIQVTHSIPGSFGLAVRTPVGTVIHTGDFKMDQTPTDGRTFDFQSFSYHGDQGVLALLSDSTNAEVAGFSGSERQVGEALDGLFRRAAGRIVVSTFSSNVHRIQQVVDLAVVHRRKVALIGSSMISTSEVAAELGYLRAPAGTLIDAREAGRLAANRVVLIAAGSQGEPMSALSRIALDDHKEVSIEAGDVVVLSARIIPGNEKSVSRVINHLYRRGAEVVAGGRPPLHVSGHASQEELRIMLTLTRPRFFIPIHGELRQLTSHARLAEQAGLPRDRILLGESGDVFELSEKEARLAGKVTVGRVFIDGTREEVDEIVVRDRRHISEGGIVLVVVAIDRHTGHLDGEPEIVSRGFSVGSGDGDLLREASRTVRRCIEAASPEERADRGVMKALIQRDLKRYFRKALDRRPMIIPAIIET
ncbi:MAG: ribonuclease J [Acidobacteria bacterium]|nr:MAG: ribonuclease J [Acidobacteria bacterium 13_1_40CM_2_68_10]OLE65386.1 MAG: ribonuclease J [Acidobacteria bacterium 13_1_20CM_2_68_14]PYT33921.1 MAG: ribonuclease J [Acidobacteriota bacterium]